MKLRTLVGLIISAFCLNSSAGLLVEPYFGTGSYATTADVSSLEQDATSFTTIGGRLGYSLLLFSAGVDYGMDQLDDSTRSNTSFFVGVDMPILIRAYGKFIINSELGGDTFDDNDIDVAFDSGYAVGVGFTGLPFVSINFEVENSKYVYENVPVVGDIDVDYVAYTLSVSLPLDL